MCGWWGARTGLGPVGSLRQAACSDGDQSLSSRSVCRWAQELASGLRQWGQRAEEMEGTGRVVGQDREGGPWPGPRGIQAEWGPLLEESPSLSTQSSPVPTFHSTSHAPISSLSGYVAASPPHIPHLSVCPRTAGT